MAEVLKDDMAGAITVWALVLVGLVLAFTYKPTKKSLTAELGWLLFAAALPAIFLFPALVIVEKMPAGKAFLISICFGPTFRYFFFGIVGTLNLIRIGIQRLVKGKTP